MKELLLGLLASSIAAVAAWIVRIIRFRLATKDVASIVGTWALYFPVIGARDRFERAELTIGRRFTGFRATVKTDRACYMGSATLTESNMFLDLSAIGHLDRVQIVFFRPLYFDTLRLWGVGSCFGLKFEPCAMRFLWTEKYSTVKDAAAEFVRVDSVSNKNWLTTRRELDGK